MSTTRAAASRSALLWLLGVLGTLWLVVSGVRLTLPFDYGLRAYYFRTTDFSDAPVTFDDAQVSSAQIYGRWRARPPAQFSIRWEGFLHVTRAGRYTFAVLADDSSRLFIDGRLIVDNPVGPESTRVRDLDGEPLATAPRGSIDLREGPHAVRVEFVQNGGRFTCDWLWTDRDGAMSRVPGWRLSTTQRSLAARVVPWIDRVWAALLGALVVVFALVLRPWSQWLPRSRRAWLRVAGGAAAVALAAFYVIAASEHARQINEWKGRADQTGYLGDAQQVYANWHGLEPKTLVGLRMRMPLYAGLLALSWDPGQRNWEFFEMARILNVWTSLILLAILWAVVAWHLPPLWAANFILVIGFGYFIFRAGYVQPELLFYFFFFLAFLAMCHLFTDRSPMATIGLALLAGGLAAAAFLTKALIPPFVVLFVMIQSGRGVLAIVQGGDAKRLGAWRVTSALVAGATFLAVISPYLVNSKRVFGDYFFNQNTTHYIWYDTGARARAILLPFTDDQGRVSLPAEQIPTLRTYVQSHTIADIVHRVTDGLRDMAVGSVSGYGFLKYLVLYVVIAGAVIIRRWRAFRSLVAEHAWLVLFLVLYGGLYLTATAFFVITSGTGGMRFILAHAAPLFYALASFTARQPFHDTQWPLGRLTLTMTHAQTLVLFVVGLDVTFFVWHRLMTTYGGY